MAQGIRKINGYTNSYPTVTTLSGTAVWNTTYMLGTISSLSFTVPAYTDNDSMSEIIINFTASTSFTASINTSNFTTVSGLDDLYMIEGDYSLSIVPINSTTLSCLWKKYTTTLPSGYTLKNSIYTTAKQIVNTGVIPNYNTILEITGYVPGDGYTLAGMGNNLSGGYFYCEINTNIDGSAVVFNAGGYSASTSLNKSIAYSGDMQNTTYKIDTSTGNLYTNGTLLGTSASTKTGLTTSYSIYLFGRNMAGSIGNCRTGGAVIKRCKIWKDGTLLRDFVPCVRVSDNKPGFYDLCGSSSPFDTTPFYSASSGLSSD